MMAAVIYRIINLLFPFVINTIIIKTLGVEYLGLNMVFASILQILSVTELGFGSAMIFSMYEPIAKRDTAKVSALLHLYRNIYICPDISQGSQTADYHKKRTFLLREKEFFAWYQSVKRASGHRFG